MRVSALLRQCSALGDSAYVLCKGDPTAGALLIKHVRRDRTCAIHARRYALDGLPVWGVVMDGPEPEIDAYIARRTDKDPDLWAIEIETAEIDPMLALI